MGYIYSITNKVNLRTYIGVSLYIKDTDKILRDLYIQSHRQKERKYLFPAMQKYGIDSFDIEILEEENVVATLLERAVELMDELDTKYPEGYNHPGPMNVVESQKVGIPVVHVETGKLYPSIDEASRDLKISDTSIRTNLKFPDKKIKGMTFRRPRHDEIDL
jgi:hypothetical protein